MTNEFNNVDERNYLGLGREIIFYGDASENRTENNTRKLFGRHLRFSLSDGKIPLLTSKKVNYKAVLAELEWFISGSTNNSHLNDLGTGIWNQWASKSTGSLGPVYGAMWRRKPISLGAVGQTMKVDDLVKRYRRTDDIIEMDREAIESVIDLNLDWEKMKAKNPGEFNAWGNMLKFCASRTINMINDDIPGVTVDPVDLEWVAKIMENTIWKEIGTDMFAATQPSDIYKPWLSFENFIKDIGRIAYNEHRDPITNRLTTFFHGVKFYSPWTTTFYTNTLQLITSDWMKRASKYEIGVERPKVFIDQLYDLIETLKNNPTSRRMIVNSWEPSFMPNENVSPNENADNGLQALTPCHHDWQVTTRRVSISELSKWLDKDDVHLVLKIRKGGFNEDYESENLIDKDYYYLVDKCNEKRVSLGLKELHPLSLDLRFSMRSTDVFLGLPFNIASYATLAHILAKLVNMNAGDLLYQGTDVHLYENSIPQMKEQSERSVKEFPTITIDDMVDINDFTANKVTLHNYNSAACIKAEVSV